MTTLIPEHNKLALLYCDHSRERLSGFRRYGDDALTALTAIFATRIAESNTNPEFKGNTFWPMAVDFGMAVIYHYPLTPNATVFLAAFEEASIKVEFNPYSDDSLTKWKARRAA